MTDEITIPVDAKDRARDALEATADINEEEYLEALITVIDYHEDETFDTDFYY